MFGKQSKNDGEKQTRHKISSQHVVAAAVVVVVVVVVVVSSSSSSNSSGVYLHLNLGHIHILFY
jgi:hypothetical protein